jgi:hypothetical protein
MINGVHPEPKKTYRFSPQMDIRPAELAAIISVLGVMGVNEEGHHTLDNSIITEIQTDGTEIELKLSRHYVENEAPPSIVVPGRDPINGEPLL